jgi:hypothetical protein
MTAAGAAASEKPRTKNINIFMTRSCRRSAVSAGALGKGLLRMNRHHSRRARDQREGDGNNC